MFFYFTQGGNNGLKLDLLGVNATGNTIQQLIGDGSKESEIEYICISDGGIGYALKKGTKYNKDNVANNSDYYFYYVFSSRYPIRLNLFICRILKYKISQVYTSYCFGSYPVSINRCRIRAFSNCIKLVSISIGIDHFTIRSHRIVQEQIKGFFDNQ
jgi:hypothetical protein